MRHLDFKAMMKFLDQHNILSTQKNLAEILNLSEATISEMKKRGSVTEKWLQKMVSVVAEKKGKDPKELFAQIVNDVPEYDAEKAEHLKEAAGVSSRDFFVPSRERCEEILLLEGGGFENYCSDDMAINKKILKKKSLNFKNIALIKYKKTNMSPKINPGDTLVIKKCSQFEGSGYYLFKEFENIKICHISEKWDVPGSFTIKITDTDHDTVKKESLSSKIIAKVMFLFRDLMISEG